MDSRTIFNVLGLRFMAFSEGFGNITLHLGGDFRVMILQAPSCQGSWMVSSSVFRGGFVGWATWPRRSWPVTESALRKEMDAHCARWGSPDQECQEQHRSSCIQFAGEEEVVRFRHPHAKPYWRSALAGPISTFLSICFQQVQQEGMYVWMPFRGLTLQRLWAQQSSAP